MEFKQHCTGLSKHRELATAEASQSPRHKKGWSWWQSFGSAFWNTAKFLWETRTLFCNRRHVKYNSSHWVVLGRQERGWDRQRVIEGLKKHSRLSNRVFIETQKTVKPEVCSQLGFSHTHLCSHHSAQEIEHYRFCRNRLLSRPGRAVGV